MELRRRRAADGPGFIKVFATERGAPVDNVVLFPPRDYWDWMIDYKLWERSLPDKFDKERQDLVMTIPLWTEDRTLETFGTQAEWELLATRMADIDPNAYVRLGWEMNLPAPSGRSPTPTGWRGRPRSSRPCSG